MTAQLKRVIEDDVNSLFQDKGLVNRGATGEVNLLHALKLGGQEGGDWLENQVPQKFCRNKTKSEQYDFCPGDSITSHAGGHHPRLGYKEKKPMIHRLKYCSQHLHICALPSQDPQHTCPLILRFK